MSGENPQSDPNSILRTSRHLSSMHFSIFTEKYYELRANRPKDSQGKLRKQWIRLTRNYIKANRDNILVNYLDAKQIHNTRRAYLTKLFFNRWKSAYLNLFEEENVNEICEEEIVNEICEEEIVNAIFEEESINEQNPNEEIIESSGVEFKLEPNSKSFSTENDYSLNGDLILPNDDQGSPHFVEQHQIITNEEEIIDDDLIIKKNQVITTDQRIENDQIIEEDQVITQDQITKEGETIEQDQIVTKETVITDDQIVVEEKIIKNEEELSPRSKAIRIKQLSDKATDVIKIPPPSLSQRINWKKILISIIIVIFAGIATYAAFQFYFDKNNFGTLYKKHKYESTLPPYDKETDLDVVIDYNQILNSEEEELSHLVKSLSKAAKNIKNRQLESNNQLNKIKETLEENKKKVETNPENTEPDVETTSQ